VQQHSYFFEQSSLANLFVSAFDEAFVYRYNHNTKTPKEKIEVRYVFGPKHRVLHDLNDRAKTLTLPVVAIEQTNVSRDTSRVFNKNKHFYYTGTDRTQIAKVPTPIPVNIEYSVSIITYFKEDLYQIIQNFVTNCNPYIIVSWKTPEDFNIPFIDEIRTEIQWSGDAPYNMPKDLSPDTKWRISADTSFTVKGWLFKSIDTPAEPIYKIDATFRNSNLNNRVHVWEDIPSLSADSITADFVSISAYPIFTNLYFYPDNGKSIPVYSDITINNPLNLLIYGKRFSYNNTWYLSGQNDSTFILEGIDTAKSPKVSAYRIPEDYVEVLNDNIARVTIPTNIMSQGIYTLMTANSASWTVWKNTITQIIS
jgi:hypothetical protein